MPILQWDHSLDTHIPSIDAEHQRLLQLLNDLHDAINAQQGEGVVEQTLIGLSGYVQDHFREEEAYMEQVHCPYLQEHRAEHREFGRQLQGYTNRLAAGGRELATEIFEFLVNWFMNHIHALDQKILPPDAQGPGI